MTRSGGAIHTGGNWSVGKAYCVVSDVPVPEIGGANEVDYYGGHMICESIASINRPIVSAAPDMFDALVAVKECIERSGLSGWLTQYAAIEAALRKATTPVEVVRHEPLPDPEGVGAGYRKIGDDEEFIPGDQFKERFGNDPHWVSVDVNIGNVKRESSLANCICRRKIDVDDPIDASFEVEPSPPIGVEPMHLWFERRRDDLYAAVDRYRESGFDVPPVWLEELSVTESVLQGEWDD